MKNLLPSLVLSFISVSCAAQDTFSIVAADSTTREVGSAGASCVDLIYYNIADASFLGDLLPDTGAINSQASYLAANQNNARARMRAGNDPAQIISWLTTNDVQSNPNIRQYGIVGFTGLNVSAAAHTGSSCMSYANHITGSIDGIYYSMQGNILLNQAILDSMEERFLREDGDLACRLMAALQGAKVIGADTRCASNGSSSLFAFIKVAAPADVYGNPSFSLGVRTQNGAGLEPIDSLQTLFSAQKGCFPTGIKKNERENDFLLFPNPASEDLTIKAAAAAGSTIKVWDIFGRVLILKTIEHETTALNIRELAKGYYFIQVAGKQPKGFIKN
jgi:uncharacterized Ntn-hydrolase superfamily protein